ncbi:DUF2971 domain-containing protein [Morganella morganii]|uniref:DUF2971 domain-containing protein n=1 Tax=Morganella TaxID=581 RepID=UPI00370CA822
MSLFKYFRPGIYLEKALRYNELYFSANHELNDPNDLVSFYKFEDDESLWYRLLALPAAYESWDIKQLYCSEQNLVKSLNGLFKEKKISSDFFSLQRFFKEINSELEKALIPFLNERLSKDEGEGEGEGENDNGNGNGNEDKEKKLNHRLALFKLYLMELLARGVNIKFFSVSFSIDALNPMMWAHYADGFKGCVVIYKAENDIINITENLYSNRYVPTSVLNVSYDDGDKSIPLIRCASTDDKKVLIQNKLLIKNKFWSYENEKRAFVISEEKSSFIANMPEDSYRINPRERIFHHYPNEIIGVIFGPNFDTIKKEKVEHILRINRHFTHSGDFFVFYTKLSPSGEIEINEGRKCIVTDHLGNFGLSSEILNDAKLDKLKNLIGIKSHIPLSDTK